MSIIVLNRSIAPLFCRSSNIQNREKKQREALTHGNCTGVLQSRVTYHVHQSVLIFPVSLAKSHMPAHNINSESST